MAKGRSALRGKGVFCISGWGRGYGISSASVADPPQSSNKDSNGWGLDELSGSHFTDTRRRNFTDWAGAAVLQLCTRRVGGENPSRSANPNYPKHENESFQ